METAWIISITKSAPYVIGILILGIIIAVLVTENDDDIQRILYKFHLTSKKYNMQISVEKTKGVTISKIPQIRIKQ